MSLSNYLSKRSVKSDPQFVTTIKSSTAFPEGSLRRIELLCVDKSISTGIFFDAKVDMYKTIRGIYVLQLEFIYQNSEPLVSAWTQGAEELTASIIEALIGASGEALVERGEKNYILGIQHRRKLL